MASTTDGHALRTTAWLLTGVSVWSLSLADFVSQRGRRVETLADEDPAELGLFILGACALMWAAPLAQLAGERLRGGDGFRLVQFFAGGMPSVLLQAFGWSCYATAVFFAIVCLLNPGMRLRGLKTGLALLGLTGQALVHFSIDMFENGDNGDRPPHDNEEDEDDDRIAPRKLLVASLAFALATIGLGLSLLIETGMFHAELRASLWNVTFALFLASVTILGVSTARAPQTLLKPPPPPRRRVHHARHKPLSQQQQNLESELAVASTTDFDVGRVAEFFAILLLICAFWIVVRLQLTPAFAAVTGSTASLGIVGFISASLSLYSLLVSRDGTSKRRRSSSLGSRTRKVSLPTGAFGAGPGPGTGAGTNLVYRVSVLVAVAALVVRFYQGQAMLAAALCMALGTPLAHLGMAWSVPSGHHGLRRLLFPPGGMEFFILQGVGFMAYAFAVGGLAIFSQASDLDLSNWGSPSWEDAGEFLLPFAFISHIALLWAKKVFVWSPPESPPSSRESNGVAVAAAFPSPSLSPPPFSSTSQAPSRPGVEADPRSVSPPPATITPPPPEKDRAKLLAQTRANVRGKHWKWSVAAAGIAGSLLLCVVAPFASVSVSLVTVVILLRESPAPFSGAPSFVIQSALGWTIYATAIAIQSILLFSVNYRNLYFEYDVGICFIRSMGLWILLVCLKDSAQATSEPEPRRRKRTEAEFALDTQEVERLLEQARRPNVVGILQRARSELVSQNRTRRMKAVGLGLAAVVGAHANLFFGIYSDLFRHQAPTFLAMVAFALCMIGSFANAFVTHGIIGKSLWGSRYQFYQPFRGGVAFVVLQTMGWPLVVGPTIGQLVCFNYGLSRVELDGLLLGLAFVSYAGQIVLLVSLAKFDPDEDQVGFAFGEDSSSNPAPHQSNNTSDLTSTIGSNTPAALGWTFSTVAMTLFVGVDLAIVRFGLRDPSLLVPLIMCGWLAIAASVPMAYFFGRSHRSAARRVQGGGGSSMSMLKIFGFALWTFSLLLGLLLVGRAASLSSMSFLSSKTGMVGLLGHSVVSLSADPTKGFPMAQQALLLVFTFGFIWIIVPAVRWLLDMPMWYWAYYFKFWKHSFSPDGKQPLEGTGLYRNISYGDNVLDVVFPSTHHPHSSASPAKSMSDPHPSDDEITDDDGDENTDDGLPSEEVRRSSTDSHVVEVSEEEHACVVWLHGGGHLFCQREVLTHSMTPLCRVGLIVYAVEYPLSPEARFPRAVVSVLQAMAWIRKYHCRGARCFTGGAPRVCAECAATTALPTPGTGGEDGHAPNPCRCCPHERGSSVVQLLGDSAGGNLAAMVTALLTNDHLLKNLAPHTGHADFLEWKFPKIQRLGLLYGLLGRDLTSEAGNEEANGDGGANEVGSTEETWTQWIVQQGSNAAVSFLLQQYAGQNNPALLGRVVLNDLESDLVDFAPETLLLCGSMDPLVATNKQALRIIRERTGRECSLILYPATHAFHGLPPQWTFGRWKNDALPATAELIKFFTGGKRHISVEKIAFAQLPRDYSPFVVLPLTFSFIGTCVWIVYHTVGFLTWYVLDILGWSAAEAR